MSFAPLLPTGGYAGWAFLQRSLPAQTTAFNASPDLQRDAEYFRSRIGQIDTAEQLVADRRLLGVALAAFGLEADLPNRFFIRKVLEGGTLNTVSLANRLANKQYQKLSATFGFGDFAVPRSKISGFADKILPKYHSRQFEAAVGQQDPDLRLALNLQRELPEIAAKSGSENTKWYQILGTPPLRNVFETALGLPRSIGALDIDQQLASFKDKARSLLGTDRISAFTEPVAVDRLLRRFLMRSEADRFAGGGGANPVVDLMAQAAQRARSWVR